MLCNKTRLITSPRLFLSALLLSLYTLSATALGASHVTPYCTGNLSINWLYQAVTALDDQGLNAFDWSSTTTKESLYGVAPGGSLRYRLILMPATVTLTISESSNQTNFRMRQDTGSPVNLYYIDFADDGNSVRLPLSSNVTSQSLASGVNSDTQFPTAVNTCIKAVRNATQTGFFPQIIEQFPPANYVEWAGAQYTDDPVATPAPEPETELSVRDIKVFAWCIALFCGYLTIRAFRWKGDND